MKVSNGNLRLDQSLKIEAVVKGDEPVDPATRRTFTNEHVVGADFSRLKLAAFHSIGSSFERCNFERMKVSNFGFGSGTEQSEFIDCSFDGTRITDYAGGFVRFTRCSFRNVNMRDWGTDYLEMIDCVLSGRWKKMIFWGSPPSGEIDYRALVSWRERHNEPQDASAANLFLRERNEFHGNDFSEAVLEDVDFREGIDLERQILPTGDDYLYLPDAQQAIDGAFELLARREPHPINAEVAVMLEIFQKTKTDSQVQKLYRVKDFARKGVVAPDMTLTFDLLRQAAAENA